MPLWPSNPKLLGERAECAFAYQAIEHGLVVSKPYGDSVPYDFIVDSGPYHDRPPRLLRVQVRSAVSEYRGWYTVRGGYGGQCLPFTSMQADFIVVYIPPQNAWYVIPVPELGRTRRAIAFRPHHATKSRWERYRDAWHLLGALTPAAPGSQLGG